MSVHMEVGGGEEISLPTHELVPEQRLRDVSMAMKKSPVVAR